MLLAAWDAFTKIEPASLLALKPALMYPLVEQVGSSSVC